MTKPTSFLRQSRKSVLALVAGVALVASAPLAIADDDAQRESLARISYELARLEKLSADASRSQTALRPARFRFDWLQKDLATVRQGIEHHLDAPRHPRPVTPLRGDYR
jgi:RAQPRD family integrative conjugative element protein